MNLNINGIKSGKLKFKRPSKTTLMLLIILVLILVAIVYINNNIPVKMAIIKFFNPDYTPIENTLSIQDADNCFFTHYRDNILIAKNDGLTLLDSSLEVVQSDEDSGNSPNVKVKGDCYIEYFDSSNRLFLCDSGDKKLIKTDNNVITACVNENGYYCVVTTEKGYKAQIIVYDDSDEEIFKWHSADNYITGVDISPNNKYLAAATLSLSGENQYFAVTVFDFSKSEPLSKTETPNDFIAQVRFTSNSEIMCIGSDMISSYSADGNVLWENPFNGENLVYYSVNDDYVVTAIGNPSSVLENITLNSYNFDGKILGSYSTNNDIINIDSSKDYTIVACKKCIKLLSASMKELNTINFNSDIKHALFFGNENKIGVVTGNIIQSVKIN